jgi:hypothetical protein
MMTPLYFVSVTRARNARWGEARSALPSEGGRERPPLNGGTFDLRIKANVKSLVVEKK